MLSQTHAGTKATPGVSSMKSILITAMENQASMPQSTAANSAVTRAAKRCNRGPPKRATKSMLMWRLPRAAATAPIIVAHNMPTWTRSDPQTRPVPNRLRATI